MARLTGPLFSLAASGTIGKAITYGSWKGIQYARTRVIPANPKSDDQVEVRNIFSCLCNMWKQMPLAVRAPFVASVRGRPMTARNRHIQLSVKALQGETDLNELVMSVSSGSSVPPTSISPADGASQNILVTCGAPAVPTGYTLSSIMAAAIEDVDPNDGAAGATFWAQDSVTPFIPDIDVLTAGEFQVAAWCVFIRTCDGQIFYSSAVRDQISIGA